MSIEVITATTDAAVSGLFRIYKANGRLPCTFVQNGLAGAEAADIQISYDGGTNFVNLYIEGTQQILSATNHTIQINTPGIYRIDKDASVGAAGVYLVTNGDP